jgi:alpha-L-fucosidase
VPAPVNLSDLTSGKPPFQVPQIAFETPSQREARLTWWREARFGLFIHWGIYSIPGRDAWVQWNEQRSNEDYAQLANQFKPAGFDATAWAKLAQEAGVKYAVFTTRHHDGFAMFDDPGSEFTSVKTAAQRDFVADYVQAMRAAGLRVGLYYSPLDWRFPGYILPDLYRKSADEMRNQYHRQMDILLRNYGRLDVIWFDGGDTDWLSFGGKWCWDAGVAAWRKRAPGEHYQGNFSWQHAAVYAQLRALQPQAIINGRADMPEDFHSREQDENLGDFDRQHPWELCTTIVKGGTWGWVPGAETKPLAHLVHLLVKAAGRDGNVLLNIGPRPDGTIDPAQAERLREIGAWLQKNGESIYSTRGGPFLPGDYGVSTCRENAIYVHVLNWPAGSLRLPMLLAKVMRASRLDGAPVTFSQNEQGIELSAPANTRDPIDTIVKLELDRPAITLTPVAVHAE